MKLLKYFIFVLITFLLFSFKGDSHLIKVQKIWGVSEFRFTDTYRFVLAPVEKLENNKWGFELKEKGQATYLRKYPSWCGTPPPLYEPVEAKWYWQKDSLLCFQYTYNKALEEECWKIIEINENQLIIDAIE